MIIDAFMFFNELDLLEIRLNALAPYVDCFVLCESTHTHSGQPKPLYFQENWHRYLNFPIKHLVYHHQGKDAWTEEYAQRDYLREGFRLAPDDALVMISDLDEIPDLAEYEGGEFLAKGKMYYYFLNAWTGTHWRGTVALYRNNVDGRSLSRVRRKRHHMPLPRVNGWHFSFLGGAESVCQKLEAFAHQEFNTDEVKGGIEQSIVNLTDPFQRGQMDFRIEMPSGPKWLLDNQDKYRHLFL